MPQPPMLQQQMQLPSAQVMKHSRNNLGDLKSQIAKRLGQERAQRYFSYLNGFLSQKLSKREFSKLCVLTVGRENLALHNQLISSILQNACQAKSPPPVDNDKLAQTPARNALKKSSQVDGFTVSQAPTSMLQSWSNGDLSPGLPHKFRSGIDNRRIKESSIIRSQIASHQPSILSDEAVLGKSDDLKRSMQQQQLEPHEQRPKRARIEETSLHDHGSVHSMVLAEEFPQDHREDLNHRGDSDSFRGPLRAPLGIPFCSVSIGGAKRSPQSSGSANTDSFHSSYDCSELYHTEALKRRMEKMVEAQGLQGVTMDCANLLNNGLDEYLKQLIRSCVELVGARTGHVSTKQPIPNLLQYARGNSSVLARNNFQVQGSIRSLESIHVLSMQNFKVAMELNPQQLGEDWPLLLEKICVRSFEE